MATTKKTAHSVEALVEMATLQIRLGNPHGAIALFTQASRLQPRNAQLLNNLGYTYQLAGQPNNALKTYQKALKRAPTDILTLCNLGLLQKTLGQTSAAKATFDRAIAFDAKDVNLLCNRGNILLESGDAQKALVDYNHAARLEPDNPSVLNGRASVLTELMQLDEARDDVNRAVQLRPDHAPAWSNRGDIYRDLDDHDEAIRSYQRALDLKPDDPKTLANLAGLAVTHPENPSEAIARSQDSLRATIASAYSAAGPAIQRIRSSGVSTFRLRHDLGQAIYLADQGIQIDGLSDFIDAGSQILDRSNQNKLPSGVPENLSVTETELSGMLEFWRSDYEAQFEMPEHCINPQNNWQDLQDEYLAGRPELLVIDNFLSDQALAALRHYCLGSRVWLREYPNKYLGAFANQGFNSELHMQLACELRRAMPAVFKDYGLNQLWGFKYDTRLGKGINIHADFALVNLNFWITPDIYHLNKEHGGLKVYSTPAPANWTFHDYNTDGQTMYDFLAEHQSGCQIIPYRYNRAVLFNSALFHETDEIEFEDCYDGRRINITYLFGRQLG